MNEVSLASYLVGSILLGGGVAYLVFRPHSMTRSQAHGIGIGFSLAGLAFMALGGSMTLSPAGQWREK